MECSTLRMTFLIESLRERKGNVWTEEISHLGYYKIKIVLQERDVCSGYCLRVTLLNINHFDNPNLFSIKRYWGEHPLLALGSDQTPDTNQTLPQLQNIRQENQISAWISSVIQSITRINSKSMQLITKLGTIKALRGLKRPKKTVVRIIPK